MDQVTSQNEHWKSHHTQQHALIDEIGATKSREYSNEVVQFQTYAHSLEALGRVDGLSITDAGCGWRWILLDYEPNCLCGSTRIGRVLLAGGGASIAPALPGSTPLMTQIRLGAVRPSLQFSLEAPHT
jgi:hypothetical protein